MLRDKLCGHSCCCHGQSSSPHRQEVFGRAGFHRNRKRESISAKHETKFVVAMDLTRLFDSSWEERGAAMEEDDDGRCDETVMSRVLTV